MVSVVLPMVSAKSMSRLLVGLDHDAGLVDGLESVGLDRDVVRAGQERGHAIHALLVGDNVAGCAGVGALDNDARAGHGAMVGIEDVAVDGAGGRALGRRGDGQQEKREGGGAPFDHFVRNPGRIEKPSVHLHHAIGDKLWNLRCTPPPYPHLENKGFAARLAVSSAQRKTVICKVAETNELGEDFVRVGWQRDESQAQTY